MEGAFVDMEGVPQEELGDKKSWLWCTWHEQREDLEPLRIRGESEAPSRDFGSTLRGWSVIETERFSVAGSGPH